MGRKARIERHCLPVTINSPTTAIPSSSSSTTIAQAHLGGLNMRLKPLTTPHGRTLPPIQKTTKSSKATSRTTPHSTNSPRADASASLLSKSDYLAIESTLGMTGGEGEGPHSITRGPALELSIMRVLEMRPVEAKEQDDRERRIKAQKESAAALKRLMKEEEERMNTSDDEGQAADDEQEEEEEDYQDDDDELVVTSVARTPSQPLFDTTTPLFPPPQPFTLPKTNVQLPFSPYFNLQEYRKDESTEMELEGGVLGKWTSVPTTQEHMGTEETSLGMVGTVSIVDETAPSTSEAMQVEPTVAASTASTAQHSTPITKDLETISSSLVQASNVPQPTNTSSTTPAQPTTRLPLPLRSAKKLLKGRHRRSKPPRSTSQPFDYNSSSESDYDAPPPLPSAPITLQRPSHGRAIEGKEECGVSPKLARLDAEILPASRAHAEKLCPKSYQTALLETAKEKNVITVLPTGSGKTLVGVLLIEWMHSTVERERIAQGEKKRLSFFLVDSVPLVHQQGLILAHNTSLRIGKLFGGLRVNLSSEAEWEWNFENYDCLVLTAQLLLDSLAHGFIHMPQICLLVFDEAHHAKSNHPFATILRDFYARASPLLRPRILGLTASPLNSNEGLAEAERLQTLFDARLVTAPSETMEELHQTVVQPDVRVVNYQRNLSVVGGEGKTALMKRLEKEFRDGGVVETDARKRWEKGVEVAKRDYGDDAGDLVWWLIGERYKSRWLPEFGEEESEDEEAKGGEEQGREKDKEFELIHPVVEGKEEEEKEDDELEMMLDPLPELPPWLKIIESSKPIIRLNHLSPKLQALVRILAACAPGAETFCGIIFVHRRIDALLIAQILKELAANPIHPDLAFLRVDCVTGHGNTKSQSLGPKMCWREQYEVLSAFGDGKVNLIVATSVVEEGLDVQPCNFVVRFDLYDTHISFVQSRGRARAEGSHYILFVEEGNRADEAKLSRISKFDKGMGALLSDVEASYESNVNNGDADYGDEDAPLQEYLLNPKTNALLTPHGSIALLERYCQSLPLLDAYSSNAPKFDFSTHYDGLIVCTLTLPANSKVRTVVSDRCFSNRLAKRSVSYTACKVLHNISQLDDHFLPIHTFPEPEPQDDQGRTVGSRKRQIGYEKKRADVWTPHTPLGAQTTLYGTLIHFGGEQGTMTFDKELYRPIVLLTKGRLPPTPTLKLFIQGEPIKVYATPLPTPFIISKEQRTTLESYSYRVWQSVLNRLMELKGEEMLCFVAPVREDSATDGGPLVLESLDWKAMEHAGKVKEEQLDWRELSGLGDSVVVDEGKNSCRYFFTKTRDDLHPSSELPPGRQSDAGYKTVLDYYKSFNAPIFHRFHVREEQSLLEVSRMPRVVTYLTATPRNDVTPSSKKLLHKTPRMALPQLCSLHSLPASIFRTALMLPSILTELDQVLLVQELNAKVFHNLIDPAILRVALITPSACLEDNYERLELLGDAFLKELSSVWCFVGLEKTAHEGDLHHHRLELIRNSTLYEAGVELDLPSYLVSRLFTSRQFVPPGFVLLKGQAPPTHALIGDKTIADVCEAILGAAYETGHAEGGLRSGFDHALAAALALKVKIPGVATWEDMSRLHGPIPESGLVAEQPTSLEETLGYRFKRSHLLQEALTHPSKIGIASQQTLERFEWLGDSVLDFLVVRYCWTRWGLLTPGHLTELKGAMASNETLAAVAVELDLDKWLAHDNPTLTQSIQDYREKYFAARDLEIAEAKAEERALRPAWLLLDPPKPCADIIESLLGAVLVDADFDPTAPQKTFEHMLVPFFSKWVSPTSLRIDAIRLLLELAQANACDDVSHLSSTIEGRITELGEVIPKMTRTSVICHGLVLGTVETANSKTAKRLVSAKAVSYLEQYPDFFSNRCDCSTRRAIAQEEAAELAQRRRDEGLETEPESELDEVEVGEVEGEAKGNEMEVS